MFEVCVEFIVVVLRLCLIVSGLVVCLVLVLEDWRRFTGRSLFERYGMTEIGMVLSNLYEEFKYKFGYVGLLLFGV